MSVTGEDITTVSTNSASDEKLLRDFGTRVRNQFPIFDGTSEIYLDSAASAQKPQIVIDSLVETYSSCYANIHRGVYRWSSECTEQFERTREKVRLFLNAKTCCEVVLTKGTTESINLVAYAWGSAFLKAGDEIIISILEHHSNFVPWQLLAEKLGVILRVAFPGPTGILGIAEISPLLNERTRLIAITGMSNVLGLLPPIKEITAAAHQVGSLVMVDAAQLVCHAPIDVQDIGADFLAFSAHKLYGPSGVGVLFAKQEILDKMPPFLSGGDMISSVAIDKTSFNTLPYRFEAGTPSIEGVIGFGAALDFFMGLDWREISQYEAWLGSYLQDGLSSVKGVRSLSSFFQGEPFGDASQASTVVGSFVSEKVHPHDLAQLLDRDGIAVRAGHHCAQPLMTHLGLGASCRASLAIYNLREEIDRFVISLEKATHFFD